MERFSGLLAVCGSPNQSRRVGAGWGVVTAVNHHYLPVNAIIVLANNPAYRFVNVQRFDQIDPSDGHIERRMVGGEHEHAVLVNGGETHTLYLPIVPIQLGEITVIVQASLPGKKIQKEVTIFVEPLGAVQEHHTSLLLDLSNRAYFFTFLDVNMSEGLVPGSDDAHVSVFGDTVGAVLPNAPATTQDLLGLPMAGCEPVVQLPTDSVTDASVERDGSGTRTQ
ncbi:uncharacterized protein LOC121866259 [Homarus americanus]|uniref:uncharacterized protein LOC121866259 n=1 Tax=Homarus americanus TaxID=6706 RepID=UPI001C46A835|nr:uncharacterized protein LOC121866259 [Homarus americanus]